MWKGQSQHESTYEVSNDHRWCADFSEHLDSVFNGNKLIDVHCIVLFERNMSTNTTMCISQLPMSLPSQIASFQQKIER